MSDRKVVELSEKAYRFLLDGLQDGTIRSGDPIARRDLARDLQISLAPVNDAVTRLEAEGFLEALPRRGTRVREISPREFRGQLLVREALETEAARIYCGRIISSKRKELEEHVVQMVEAAIDAPTRFRLDMNFHVQLVALTDCETLVNHFLQLINKELFLAAQQHLPNRVIQGNAKDETFKVLHLKLIDDLCKADPLQADALIRTHIRQNKTAIFADNLGDAPQTAAEKPADKA